jgi:hypothetical protein
MKSHRQMRRPCPVPFCGNAARQGHLMCRDCWGAVPADIQREVNAAWRTVRTATRDRSALLRVHVSVYRRATDAAIAAAQAARP